MVTDLGRAVKSSRFTLLKDSKLDLNTESARCFCQKAERVPNAVTGLLRSAFFKTNVNDFLHETLCSY